MRTTYFAALFAVLQLAGQANAINLSAIQTNLAQVGGDEDVAPFKVGEKTLTTRKEQNDHNERMHKGPNVSGGALPLNRGVAPKNAEGGNT